MKNAFFRRESGRMKLAGEGRDVFASFSGAKKWFQGFFRRWERLSSSSSVHIEDRRRAKKLKSGFFA